MLIRMLDAFLLFLLLAIWLCPIEAAQQDLNSLMNEFPLDCLLRDYKFNVSLTDNKGRKCWGEVTTKVCYGYCLTMEVISFYYIHFYYFFLIFLFTKIDGPEPDDRIITSKICTHTASVPKKTTLSNCEKGMSTKSKQYRYQQAVACSCSRYSIVWRNELINWLVDFFFFIFSCNPSTTNCKTGSSLNSSDLNGEFGQYSSVDQLSNNIIRRRRDRPWTVCA